MFNGSVAKSVFGYAVMPQIMPRIRGLFTGGFGYVPFFIAVVYQMVGLLPRQHPYLQQHNIGRFGIRHVISEAAGNLQFSLKNIDQIILFFAVLAGMALFFIQLLAFAFLVMFQPAYALPTNWLLFFTTTPIFSQHDLAYMMLDMVFGVPNATVFGVPLPGSFFGSCIASTTVCFDNVGTNIPDLNAGATPLAASANELSPLSSNAHTVFPFPYHDGLHRLFSVYSTGLLVVAVGVLSYFVATVIAETAQSGTPFGRRFNKTWAPLRIVIAFGLLMPLTVGLNSSQYLVLYAAKYGSAFASNGWRYFNFSLLTSYQSGLGEDLVAVPNVPELNSLTSFLFIAKTCKTVYEFHYVKNRQSLSGGPAVTQPAPGDVAAAPLDEQVRMYVLHAVTSVATEVTSNFTFESFVSNTGVTGADPSGGDMSLQIVFGTRTPQGVNNLGNIYPVCGRMKFTFQDPRPQADAQPGPNRLHQAYYNVLRDLWHEEVWTAGGAYNDVPNLPVPAYTSAANHRHEYYAKQFGQVPDFAANEPMGVRYPTIEPVDISFVSFVDRTVQKEIQDVIAAAVAAQNTSGAWDLHVTGGQPVMYLRGWAAAGIWYNRIAQLNGQIVAAVYGVPSIVHFPLIMEKVKELKAENDRGISGDEAFKPELEGADSMATQLGSDGSVPLASALYEAMNDWNTLSQNSFVQQPSDNPVLSFISEIFGVDGLYSMRKNPSTHPLAMLAGIGRSLVESSIRATTYALALTGIGAFAPAASAAEKFTSIGANFLVMIATLGLTVGFVLFYIVPFLPFIYFFFAVGGWIKGIFEALVGAPLWALAHIRIDGNGMPGNAAMNGYFLIFEVFVRPILILFGMLASISIYAALVSVLNDVFPLLAHNVGGYDTSSEISIPTGQSTLNVARGQIDEFFYTVIYAIIVYIMGMASFKLIDMIPNNILRWMGQSVATFGDQREDPAQGMVSKATIGSQQAVSRLGSGLSAVVNMNSTPR